MPGILDNLGKKFNSISPMEYFQFGAGILGQPNNVGLGIQQGLLGASQAREQMEERKRHEALGAAIKDTSLPMELRSLLSALPPDQAGMALAQYMMQGQGERKIVKGADGYNYYADTQERVLPGIKAPPPKGDKPANLQDYEFLDPETGETHRGWFNPDPRSPGYYLNDENGNPVRAPQHWERRPTQTEQGVRETKPETRANELYSKARTFIQAQNNLFDNLKDDAAPTLGGSAAKTINSFVANVSGLVKAFAMGEDGKVVEDTVKNNILAGKYTDYLASLGVTNAKLQSSVIMSAYLQASLIADQHGRALSDTDFERNLQTIAKSAHKETIEANVHQNMGLFWAKLEAEARTNPHFAPMLPELRALFKYAPTPKRPTLIQDPRDPLSGLPGFEGIIKTPPQ